MLVSFNYVHQKIHFFTNGFLFLHCSDLETIVQNDLRGCLTFKDRVCVSYLGLHGHRVSPCVKWHRAPRKLRLGRRQQTVSWSAARQCDDRTQSPRKNSLRTSAVSNADGDFGATESTALGILTHRQTERALEKWCYSTVLQEIIGAISFAFPFRIVPKISQNLLQHVKFLTTHDVYMLNHFQTTILIGRIPPYLEASKLLRQILKMSQNFYFTLLQV